MRSPSTAGRLCAVRAEQITEPLALHGEGPCWLARSGELAWVDMLAGRVLATSLARGDDARRSTSRARSRRSCARAPAGGLVVATETGVVLLDESDEPSVLCEILDEQGVRMNDGGCDPQGRFWCGSMAYDARPGAGSLYRVETDGSVATALAGVTISNGLGWSADGATAFYVDSTTYAHRQLRVRRRERDARRAAAVRRDRGEPRHCPTASPSTPRAASGSRSGTAARCAATRPTGRSTPSCRCPAGA